MNLEQFFSFIQECPGNVLDYRALQCSAFNKNPYSGEVLNWVPYHDSKNPCALYCQAEGHDVIHRLANHVVDGTKCRNDSKDMCIDGKCWVLKSVIILQSSEFISKIPKKYKHIRPYVCIYHVWPIESIFL